MAYVKIASRLTLIGVVIYGAYSICEMFKTQFENDGYYMLALIGLVAFSLLTVTDWNFKIAGK